jgi:fucose permease
MCNRRLILKKPNRYIILLIVIYLSFISLGLPDGVLGVAWPAIRTSLGLPLENLGILTTLLLCMSAVSSFMSGRVIAKWGTGRVALASGVFTGCALLGYSLSPGFWWIILFTIPLGLGQGAVDSGLNQYVAEHYSSRHMNWLHCFWGVGASLGPLIMTSALAHGNAWRQGYGTVSIIQLLLASLLLFSIIKGLWENQHQGGAGEADQIRPNAQDGLSKISEQILAMFLFFLYAAIEFSMGFWIYSVLIESRRMPVTLAGIATTSLYAAIMTGRFLTGFVVNKAGNMRMIRLGLLLAIAGCVCLGAGKSYAGEITGVVLVGLGLAPVYPCLMHETPTRFQKTVSDRLIGYQVGAACLGGSIGSSVVGIVLSHFSLELLFPILCIFLMASFAVNEILNHGAKLKSE